MAQIKQIGPGRKTTGTIDGIVYVTRNGKTFVRAAPTMPAKVFQTPGALRRQAIFKMIQMHIRHHLRTIKQTFTPKGNGTAYNRYYSENGKALTNALGSLADRLVAGDEISITDVETAIATYAAAHPTSIFIAKRQGYGYVNLTGPWPDTITLTASSGHSTIVILVAENGTTTTITPDGSTTVSEAVEGNGSGSGSGTSASSGTSSGTSSASTVATPVISGASPSETTTSVTISCATSGASIYYTTDGSTPTAESIPYTEAVTLSDTTTVKAFAVSGSDSSAVASRTFTKGNDGDGSDTD